MSAVARSGGSFQRGGDRGAAMVEFAIIAPVLIMLVFGIIEFGRGYNAKIELTGAVREGARVAALRQTDAEVITAVQTAAPTLGLDPSDITIEACPAAGSGTARVTATHDLAYNIPLLPRGSGTWNISVTGAMRCGL